jgi:predicted GNAT family N-acyltransferase
MIPFRASLATVAEGADLRALRHRVFVVEQGVPVDMEQDELDDIAAHAVVRDPDGRVVGTGRMVPLGGGSARIGRMAVAPEARGSGVGAALLAVLEDAARGAGCRRAEIHAQVQAIGFYRRAGYEPAGEPFDEAGIPHVAMVKALEAGGSSANA